MSFIGPERNVISTANSTVALLGPEAIFTGAWEDVTQFETVATAILGSMPTDGELFFDLSTDNGATYTSVPSSIGDTTFAVPRILNVVEDYVRIRYVNGTTQMTGDFSIRTKYSNGQQMDLLSSVDGFVNGETPTAVVRAIATAKDPQNNFKNVAADGAAFETTALLDNAVTFDSGILDLTNYTQVQTEIVASHDGTIDITFYSDSVGADEVRMLAIPYVGGSGFQLFAAPAFGNHVRYEFTNTGGATQTDFYYSTKFLTKAISGQVLSTGAFIAPSMVANLGRNILVGLQPNGTFKNDPANGVAVSDTNLLTSGSAFTSPWIDTHGYSIIETFIVTNVISAIDGVEFEFTDDLSGTPTVRFTESFSLTVVDIANGGMNIFLQPKMVGFRVRYTNGVTNQTGSFLLQTDLKTNGILASALDTHLTGKEGATITRSVITAEQPSGDFKNDPANGIAVLETGVQGIANVFTSAWIDTHGYNVIETFIKSDQISAVDGIVFEFTDDLSGTPTVQESHDQTFSAKELADGSVNIFILPKLVGVRIKYTNGATATDANFILQVDMKTNGILAARLDAVMYSDEDVANVRAVIAGQEPSGSFENVSVTQTTNDSGTYHNLNVVSGARPSELAGRVVVRIVLDGITANSLEHTVTADKVLYITDMLLTIVNTGAVTGNMKFRDGITVAGGVVLPIGAADPGSGGDDTITVSNHSFIEPLEFDVGVFVEEAASDLSISGVLIGYEE